MNNDSLNIYADNSKLIEGQILTNSHLSKIANKPDPYFQNGKVVGTINGNKVTIINN